MIKFKTNWLKRFAKNQLGKDYIVGDIHGHFSDLEDELARIGFNPETDRLFSVGDTVDRGPESELVSEWMAKPWFHMLLGNHEQMCIDYFYGMGESDIMCQNGAAWFVAMTPPERGYYVDLFDMCPIAMELETSHGIIGMVHAEVPYGSWSTMKSDVANPSRHHMTLNLCQWLMSKLRSNDTSHVQGVSAVVVGHQVVPKKTVLGNVHYIDTGSGFTNGHLTIIDAETLSVV